MAFVDTSFLYAVAAERDERHQVARKLLLGLLNKGERLTISTLVLGETWTLIGRRRGHGAAVELIEMVRQSNAYEVLHVEASLADRAFDWLRDRGEREYSFVDATSFQIMWDNRIDTALSFDADFDAVGFVTLRS